MPIANRIILFFTISIVILMPIVSISGDSDQSEPTMKIYYTEFSTVPYGPITSETIEKRQDLLIWTYGKHQFIDQLKALLEGLETTKKIDASNIRLKTIIRKGPNAAFVYLVDYYGVVLRSDTGKTFLLSNKQMKELGEKIFYFHGVVDQRPNVDPW